MGGRSGGSALPVARLRGSGAGFLLAVCSAGSAVRAVPPSGCRSTTGCRCSGVEGRRYGGGGQAFCVRTCEAGYFPLTDRTTRAARNPAAACVRRAKPKWSTAAASTMPRPTTETLYGTAERVPLPQRARLGLHLQRQGRARPGAGQDRGRPDAAQGRHRRRRKRFAGCTPPRNAAPMKFSPASDRIKSRYRRAPVVAGRERK